MPTFFLKLLQVRLLPMIAHTLKSISAVHIFTAFTKLKERKFWGSGLWSRGCYYGSAGAITKESVKRYVNDLQDKPEGLDVSVLPTGSVSGSPVALHPYG